MMSKQHTLLDCADKHYFIVRKNKTTILVLPKGDNQILESDIKAIFDQYPNFTKMSVGYLTEDNYLSLKNNIGSKATKNKYTSTLVLSKFDDNFFNLSGKARTELRETRNSLDRRFYYKVNEPAGLTLNSKVESLLKWWDENPGQKYGWQRHSGYDRNFFNNLYKDLENKITLLTFYDKSTNEMVGYSAVSNDTILFDNKRVVPYIIRKSKTDIRNITLYIDYYTFKTVYDANKEAFYVNWGASSDGVLKYKTTKFPVGHQEKSYFLTLKKENLEHLWQNQ